MDYYYWRYFPGNPILRSIHLAIAHAQLFYKDASGHLRNIGYFDDGLRSDEKFFDNISHYRFNEVQHVAINDKLLYPSQYTANNYRWDPFNHQQCQDYIAHESQVQHFKPGGF